MRAKNLAPNLVEEENEEATTTVRFLEKENADPNESRAPRPPESLKYHEVGHGLTTAKKLALVFALLLVCWGISGFFSMHELHKAKQNLSRITDLAEPLSAAAYEMEISFFKGYASFLEYLNGHEERNLERFRSENAHFEGKLQKFHALAEEADVEKNLMARLDSGYRRCRSLMEDVLSLDQQREKTALDLEKNKQKKLEELDRGGDEVQSLLNEGIQVFASQNLQESKTLVYEEMDHSLKINLILLLLGIVVGVTSAFGLTRNIARRLQIVVAGVRKVAEEKDLTQEISVSSQDEMGIMGRMFNNMRQSLYDVILKIHQASLKINSSSNEILAASTQHESVSAEQSSQMNQIQATLTQAAATAAQLNQNAQEVVRSNQEISREAEEGGKFIEGTDVKMKAMVESNQTVGLKLRTLNEKIEGVGKILATILSVSDQTNLLSLNAAIEAAKAGEHGKGFGVVAQEIRRLADQTAQSSQEISNIVNEVQAASSSAIMVMEKSAQDVVESTHMVGELGERFSRITGQVQNILPQIEQISQSIGQLAVGNKEVSASVTEMNKALKLTLEAAKQLRQAAYDLTSMGQQLRGAVGQFKMK